MSRITLIAFFVFTLIACKTTKQAIDHSESTEAPDAFEEGMVEEIDTDGTGESEPSESTPEKRVKKEPLPFKNKIKNGIDFIAMGTEPFWAIDINFDTSFTFTSLSEIDSIQFPFEIPTKENEMDLLYVSTTKNSGLRVVVKDSLCVNQMSGDEFNYSVEVSVKEGKMKDFKTFTGCGQYLGDLHLTGEWDFITFNGDSIQQTTDLPKTPFLTFSLKERTIAGYAGCNTIHGAFDFGYKTINFSPLVSTRKFCPNMEMEDKVMKALSDKTFSYTLSENDLILKNDENTIVFEKH